MPVLPDYDSPLALKKFLDDRGMAMQKKFGQNFMVNRAHRQRLVDALLLEPGMGVWEVGPGLGAITDELLNRGANLTVFEIDRGFASVLRDIFVDRENFTLIEGDVLRTWKTEAAKCLPPRLFGNLPYNIAATIIADTISAGVRFDRAVFTVQKEVALRMAAKPSTEDYSSFSVLCQWAYKVTPLMDLAAGAFWPRPNVISKAVSLERRGDWPRCESPALFMSLLRGLFSSRRKTIKNNLSAWLRSAARISLETDSVTLMEQCFERSGIDPLARAETLDVADFLKFSDTLHEAGVRP